MFSSDGITSVLQPALVAQVEELLYRSRAMRVAVTDTGGEEFDTAAAGAFAPRARIIAGIILARFGRNEPR